MSNPSIGRNQDEPHRRNYPLKGLCARNHLHSLRILYGELDPKP
jgi:hypothetical protein